MEDIGRNRFFENIDFHARRPSDIVPKNGCEYDLDRGRSGMGGKKRCVSKISFFPTRASVIITTKIYEYL